MTFGVTMPDRHFWDTCCWLDYVEEQDSKQPMTMLWGAVTRGSVELLFSPVVMAEMLMRPSRSTPRPWTDPHPIDSLFETPGLTLVQIDRPVGERARSLRRQFSLKTPDALHLAAALEHNVDVLITRDDKDLAKLPTVFRKDGEKLAILSPQAALHGPLYGG